MWYWILPNCRVHQNNFCNLLFSTHNLNCWFLFIVWRTIRKVLILYLKNITSIDIKLQFYTAQKYLICPTVGGGVQNVTSFLGVVLSCLWQNVTQGEGVWKWSFLRDVIYGFIYEWTLWVNVLAVFVWQRGMLSFFFFFSVCLFLFFFLSFCFFFLFLSILLFLFTTFNRYLHTFLTF